MISATNARTAKPEEETSQEAAAASFAKSEGQSFSSLHGTYCDLGFCKTGGLLDDCIKRLIAEEPSVLKSVFPGTIDSANMWLTALRNALFERGSKLLLGNGRTAPDIVSVSDQGEIILEWSKRGRRVTLFLHMRHTSAVWVAMVNGTARSEHYDELSPALAADLLLAYWS